VWEGIAVDVMLEWRWQHDREALLAEIAAEQAQRKAQAAMQLQQQAKQPRPTLGRLARRKLFVDWEGHVGAAQIRRSRQIMARTIADLRCLGPKAGEAQKLKILRRCIEQFNVADARQQFIDTMEREDICEVFYLVSCACGLGDREELADEWRDW
jgi:hypothetical protein